MKTFTIDKTAANLNWILANLDERDYTLLAAKIAIRYFSESQKTDILAAIA